MSETLVFDRDDRVFHSFLQPGPHRYVGECYFPTWNGVLQIYDSINVKTKLDLDKLNLTFSPQAIPYLKSSIIYFSHSIAFPVTYRFAIGSFVIVKKSKRFLKLESQFNTVGIEVNKKLQQSLGPGEYPFTLILNNSISRAKFTANISFSQALKGANITMDRFVATKPHYFTIHIGVSEGAPVFVNLEIRKYPGIELESKISGNCYFHCTDFEIRARAERGAHMIDVSMYNSQNGLTFQWGPFHALPQVYDAYITSTASVQVGHENPVLIFIRGDLGNYLLILIHDEKIYQERVDYYTTRYQHNLGVSLPFDPSSFVLVRKNMRFSKLGWNFIKMFIKNEKQTFTFASGKVFVRQAPSCLKNVLIKGPPMTLMENNIVQIPEKLEFRAEVILQCVDGNSLTTEWGIVRTNDPGKVPDLLKGYVVKSRKQSYELDPSHFDPGYYVVIISVTTKKPRTYIIVDSAKKYLIVRVIGGRLTAFIKGGRIREIGKTKFYAWMV